MMKTVRPDFKITSGQQSIMFSNLQVLPGAVVVTGTSGTPTGAVDTSTAITRPPGPLPWMDCATNDNANY